MLSVNVRGLYEPQQRRSTGKDRIEAALAERRGRISGRTELPPDWKFPKP